jgi:hypothetical protein
MTMNTITGKFGVANEVISYMQNADNKTVLKTNGFDTTPPIARLQAKNILSIKGK